MKSHPHAKLGGFTLIELLTVIAIIGILAAILIPTVAKVRESAHGARNRSNIRALVLANNAYETDFRYYAPNHHSFTQDPKPDPYRAWPQRVAPYAGFRDWDPDDWDGPFAAKSPPPGIYAIPGSAFLYTGDQTKPITLYERNEGFWGSQDLINRRLAISSSKNLPNPSRVWMITDNSNFDDNNQPVSGDINNTTLRPGRFGGIYVYGMADGSLKAFKAGTIPPRTGDTEPFHNVMKNR